MIAEQQAQVGSTFWREGSIAEAREFLLAMGGTRIAVTGRPGIGKSLVTKGLGFESTDLFLGLSWEAQRNTVLDVGKQTAWLLEGVTVARALRHGLAPDALLWLRGTPLRAEQTAASIRLGDSVDKWVMEALPSLVAAGVYVVEWWIKEPKYA